MSIVEKNTVEKEYVIKLEACNDRNFNIAFCNSCYTNPSNPLNQKIVLSFHDLFYGQKDLPGAWESLPRKDRFIEKVSLGKNTCNKDVLKFSFEYDYSIELNDNSTIMIVTLRLGGLNTTVRKIHISIPELTLLRLE